MRPTFKQLDSHIKNVKERIRWLEEEYEESLKAISFFQKDSFKESNEIQEWKTSCLEKWKIKSEFLKELMQNQWKTIE